MSKVSLPFGHTMERIDYLVHPKCIITCNEADSILENHALAIKDGKIRDILPNKQVLEKYHPTTTLHYSSKAILPGFINAHTHSAMVVFRGLADDLELMDWLYNYVWPAESKWVSKKLVYDASLIAMAEMIRSGTTCFNDMYFFLEDTAKAAIEAGMRGFIGLHIINVPTAWAKSIDEYFDKGLAFYEEYKNNPLIRPTMAPHSTYMVPPEALLKAKEIANRYHLKTNIHLQEAPSEIQKTMSLYHKRPLDQLLDLGMISPDLIAIHMTQVNERDFATLMEYKPNIVHCPESNMKTLSGACPVEKLLQLGINVALGTDGAASNNDLDMIGEMRTAAFLGKTTANDARAVSAKTALRMATINGAKALGIDQITGSLMPGKAADFIAMDLDQIETQPLYAPISQIVYAASRHQVTDVWVAGKQLLQDRKLLTLDEEEILKKAKIWREKIKL